MPAQETPQPKYIVLEPLVEAAKTLLAGVGINLTGDVYVVGMPSEQTLLYTGVICGNQRYIMTWQLPNTSTRTYMMAGIYTGPDKVEEVNEASIIGIGLYNLDHHSIAIPDSFTRVNVGISASEAEGGNVDVMLSALSECEGQKISVVHE